MEWISCYFAPPRRKRSNSRLCCPEKCALNATDCKASTLAETATCNRASALRVVTFPARRSNPATQVFVDWCKLKSVPSLPAQRCWRERSSDHSRASLAPCRCRRAKPYPESDLSIRRSAPSGPATTSGVAPSQYGASVVAGGACGEATVPQIAAAMDARDWCSHAH